MAVDPSGVDVEALPPGTGLAHVAQSALASLRIRTVIHRYVVRTMDRIDRPPQPEHAIGIRTLHLGPEPIRVLVLGDSNAVGYGVRDRAETNDRFLSDELAARTGRGIVLENRGIPYVGVARSVDSLGAAGVLTFHVAVWSPSFVEGVERLLSGGWRDELRRMIECLRAEVEIPIVLLRMPLPTGPHYSVPLLRWGWRRINATIEAVAAEYERVHVGDVDDVPLAQDGTPFVNVDNYRSTSRLIAPAVLRALGLGDRTMEDTAAPVAC